MRKPSHRKNNPNWPRKQGRPRDQKRLLSPAWMTPEVMALMRKIHQTFLDMAGPNELRERLEEAIERDIDAQAAHASGSGSSSSR